MSLFSKPLKSQVSWPQLIVVSISKSELSRTTYFCLIFGIFRMFGIEVTTYCCLKAFCSLFIKNGIIYEYTILEFLRFWGSWPQLIVVSGLFHEIIPSHLGFFLDQGHNLLSLAFHWDCPLSWDFFRSRPQLIVVSGLFIPFITFGSFTNTQFGGKLLSLMTKSISYMGSATLKTLPLILSLLCKEKSTILFFGNANV
jgi:hypothetical protein